MSIQLNVYDEHDAARLVMAQAMIERQHERFEGWVAERTDPFPAITLFSVPVVLGMFAWSIPSYRVKLIKRKHAVNIGAGDCTPGDIARDYLALKYPNRRKRITTSQYKACITNRISAPLFCEPQTIEHACYVDIISAYWSIVRVVGWDVNYNPSRFLCVQSDNEDFPFPKIKLARNCLVSVGLSASLTLWTGETLITQRKPNQFANMTLYRLVMDVLNGIAYDAVQAGACYAYTDGFITPIHRVQAVRDAISGWGLSSGIKREGESVVHAPAQYSFPNFRTRNEWTKRPIRTNKIADTDRDWLRWRFRTFAEERLR